MPRIPALILAGSGLAVVVPPLHARMVNEGGSNTLTNVARDESGRVEAKR